MISPFELFFVFLFCLQQKVLCVCLRMTISLKYKARKGKHLLWLIEIYGGMKRSGQLVVSFPSKYGCVIRKAAVR